MHTFEDAHSLGAHHVVVDVNNGGTTAASSGFGQEVVLWDLAKGKEKLRLDPKDGHLLQFLMLNVGTDDQEMPDTIGKTWALEFSPDANVLYTTSYHGRIVLWDTRSFKRITEVETKGFFGMTVAAVRHISVKTDISRETVDTLPQVTKMVEYMFLAQKRIEYYIHCQVIPIVLEIM